MAHFHSSLLCVPLARAAALCAGVLTCALSACFFTFFLAVLCGSSTPAYADAWLDRVERNLRRIESASELAEPVRIGSRAAKKAHGKCTRDGDLTACERIIWRQKELLPIEDWAVGTAHIKRGEMREKAGDVDGALEDYRDALSYHSFPHLNGRIKRLTLRQRQREKDNKQVVQSGRETQSEPVAVVDGWAPKFRSNVAPESAPRAGADSEALGLFPPIFDGSKSQRTAHSPLQGTPSDQERSDDAPSDVAKSDNVAPSPDHKTDVATKRADVNSEGDQRITTKAAATPIPQTQNPETVQSQPPVVQPYPIRMAEDGVDQVGEGRVREGSRGVSKDRLLVAKTETTVSPHAPTNAISNDEMPSLSEETPRVGQPKIRQTPAPPPSGNPDITTSALPTQAVDVTGDVQRQVMMALIALVLGSSLVLVVFNRGSWWGRRSTKMQGEPSLRVEDLERLIAQRSAEASLSPTRKQTVPYPSPPSPAQPSADLSLVDPSADDDGDEADDDADDVGTKVDFRSVEAQDTQAPAQPTPASSELSTLENTDEGKEKQDQQEWQAPALNAPPESLENGSGEEALPSDTETSIPVVSNNGDEEVSESDGRCFQAFVSTTMLPKLEPLVEPPSQSHDGDPEDHDAKELRTLLRRVSFGAAGIIIAGQEELLQSTIAQHVDAARRPELIKRLMRWDLSEPRATGILNPFDLAPATADPLIASQHFNAAFEFYTAIFETIFGSQFVRRQKVQLRHIALLLHAMPSPNLNTLCSCLEDRRSLEPLRGALNKIDSVPTRLFFATTFPSDEFSEAADFMRQRLTDLLSNEQVMHLCGDRGTASPFFGETSDIGRVVFLPLDGGCRESASSPAVLLRCLFAVLRLQQLTMKPAASGEGVAVSLYIPELAKLVGGDAGDVDFFVTQLKQAGYDVF